MKMQALIDNQMRIVERLQKETLGGLSRDRDLSIGLASAIDKLATLLSHSAMYVGGPSDN